MKKLISLLMIIALIAALAGCSSTAQNSSTETTAAKEEETTAEKTPETPADNKSLVVYFSRTGEQYGVGVIDKGNTAIVADMIVDLTGADSFEIKPKKDNYPTTYKELTDVAKQEQSENSRPEIASTIENFDSYDTIYLGYPIWWYDLPMICYTFLESYDFSGKTIIPFCTHEGSNDSGTQDKIKSAVPNAEVREVFAIQGRDTQNDFDSVKDKVTEWIAH